MTALANPRREKFCKLVALHGNYSRAARGAGYSLKSAGTEGSRLMQDAVVIARIQQLLAADAALLSITKAEALHEMSSLAKFNPQDLYDDDGMAIPIQDLPPDVAVSIKELEHEYIPAQVDPESGEITVAAHYVVTKLKAGQDKRPAVDMALRVHNAYEDDNAGKTQVHIHLDEKDMKA